MEYPEDIVVKDLNSYIKSLIPQVHTAVDTIIDVSMVKFVPYLK
jgi:hypothetical protein